MTAGRCSKGSRCDCTRAASGSGPAALQEGCQHHPRRGRQSWEPLQGFSMGIQQDLFSDEAEVGSTRNQAKEFTPEHGDF